MACLAVISICNLDLPDTTERGKNLNFSIWAVKAWLYPITGATIVFLSSSFFCVPFTSNSLYSIDEKTGSYFSSRLKKRKTDSFWCFAWNYFQPDIGKEWRQWSGWSRLCKAHFIYHQSLCYKKHVIVIRHYCIAIIAPIVPHEFFMINPFIIIAYYGNCMPLGIVKSFKWIRFEFEERIITVYRVPNIFSVFVF